MSLAQQQPAYTDAQANEILRTAVRLAAPEEITFEEMVLAAAELGISREELREAEEQFKRNSSEAGQIAEFKRMQRRQVGSAAYHVLFIAVIVELIVLIDFREWALSFSAAVLLGIVGYVTWQFLRLRDFQSEANQAAFEQWKRKKAVWLRPERAREIVHEVLTQKPSLAEKYDGGSPNRKLEKRLRERLGYDRVRARTVLEAYIRENPEFELEFQQ